MAITYTKRTTYIFDIIPKFLISFISIFFPIIYYWYGLNRIQIYNNI